MKILRLFDSLKFVRVMFVAIVAIFAFAPAHAATLPAGYTELEYIQSTGTQYIDTGMKGNENTKVEIRWQFPQTSDASGSGRIFGSRIGSSSDAFVVGTNDGMVKTGSRYFFAYDNQAYLTTNTVVTTAVWLTIIHDRLTHSVNGTDFTKDYASDTFETPQNLKIFGYDNNGTMGYGRGMCAYVKIWEGNNLVRDFVPARRDSDGVVGMYDLADSNPATAFHINAGTGEFIAGEYKIKIATTHYNETKFAPVETRLDAAVAAVNTVVTQTMSQAQAIDTIATSKQTRPDEGCTAKYCLLVEDEQGVPHWYPIAGANGVAHALPAGYTELQYIESTGTQYIDPDVSGNATFIGTAQSTTDSPTTSQVLVANGGASAGRWFGVQSPSAGEPFSKRWGLGATSRASTTIYGTTKIDFNITFSDVDGQYGTVNNETLTRTTSKPTQGDWIAFAGTESSQYGFIGKVWGLKVVQNDVLVRNLIPAKNSSNVVGMYDLVSGRFFTNDGTGDFTAGPDM